MRVVATNSQTEQQTDEQFLCPLQRLNSADVVVHADGDSSWVKLLRGPIVSESTPPRPAPSSSGLRQPDDASQRSSSPLRSACRPARRSLFSRRVASPAAAATTSGDCDNATSISSSYRRCASDTVANTVKKARPTPPPITKSRSMSTAVLSAADTDDDDRQRLVGDFTRPLCLPTVSDTKHCDLNAISHDTVYIWTTHVG